MRIGSLSAFVLFPGHTALKATTTKKVFAKTAEITTENITPENVCLRMQVTGLKNEKAEEAKH